MKQTKRCVICDTLFVATRSSQVCCSAPCRYQRQRQLSLAAQKERKKLQKIIDEPVKRKNANKSKKSIEELNAEARASGMSYGQLQAEKYKMEMKI